MLGLLKNVFKSMSNLDLSFPYFVGVYKIYIEFVPLKFVKNYHLFYLTSYIDLGIIFIYYDSLRVDTIIGDTPHLSNYI